MAENQETNWDSGSLPTTQSSVSGTSEDESSSSSGGSNDKEEKQEIPITDEEEALSFGYTALGKLMRNDGHQIELKVIGNIDYRVGAWIRVFLPSFNENCMMFISKANHEASADGEWITSLTLVDYPPSISKGESNAKSGSLSSDEGSNENNDENENEENNDSSSSQN